MGVPRIPPYEGPEPYLFISYSHKDFDRVYPVLSRLYADGFRIWYDEGIDPGSEWPESIAVHLTKCRTCLAFISDNYIQSPYCRRELNFVLSKNLSKDLGFISVMLEPCRLSPGVELQLSTYQSLYLYKYPEMDLFYQRLSKTDLLQPCRGLPPVEPEAPAAPIAPAETPDPPRAGAPAEAAEPPEPPPAAAPVDLPAAAPEPPASVAEKPAKEKKQKPAKPAGDRPKRKKLWLLAPILLLIVGAVFVLSSRSSGVTIDGKTFTYANIRDVKLTKADVRSLKQFKKDEYFYFTDCTFEPGALDAMAAPVLRSLGFERCSGIDSLAFIADHPELHTLKIVDCGLTDGVLPAVLPTPKLSTLELPGNALTAIPLPQDCSHLNTVNLAGNPLADLSPLAKCGALTALDIRGCGTEDLTPLAGLSGLRRLYAADNRITDVTPLSSAVYLEELDLSRNRIDDWSGLANVTRLTLLRLGGNPSSAGAGSLRRNALTLLELDVSGLTPTEELLGFLAECTSVKTLNAGSCGMTDEYAAVISGMTQLQKLNLADNLLTGCRFLDGLRELRSADLSGNRISDLSGFPTPSAEADNPKLFLLLHDNALTALTGLPTGPEYALLTLWGNPLADLKTLNALHGSAVAFDFLPGSSVDPLRTATFLKYYVCSVPLDQKVDLEEALLSAARRPKYWDVTAEDSLSELLKAEFAARYFSFG